MENITIKQALSAHTELANMKLSKFDKEIRTVVIVNYAKLSNIYQEQKKLQETMQEKMFDDKKEQIKELSMLRANLHAAKTKEEIVQINQKIISEYSDVIQLEEDFNKLIKAETLKEVAIDIQKVDMDKFIENMIRAEIDFTPATINKLNFMFN